MHFNHVCLIVSDIDEALKLWRDVFGLVALPETVIPDGQAFDQKTLDDIFHVEGAKSRMLNLYDPNGHCVIELEQPLNPPVKKTPREDLQYYNTGIHELALGVENIEEWFDKIKAAGYETQTDYVWEIYGSKSFLFYDSDGNMIQLVEVINPPQQ